MRAVGALLALALVLAMAAFPQTESQKSSQPSATVTTDALAVEADAAAIVQILAAGSSSFEQIQGPLKEEMQPGKKWHVAVLVPGFDCSLLTFGPERRNQDFIGCSADVSAAMGESTYVTIAKALTEQLRTMGYNCKSPAEVIGKSTADIDAITGRKTIHRLLCSRTVYESFVVLSIQRYISPKNGFLVSLNVNSSPIRSDAVPMPSSRASLPQPTTPTDAIPAPSSRASLPQPTTPTDAISAPSSRASLPQPATESQQPIGAARRKLPPNLNGDWSCDPSSYRCEKASATVLGGQFAASIDTGEYLEVGHRCNSADKHCVWSLTGTIEGLGIRGVATQASVHGDPSNCDSPATRHSFDATLSDDGQRITIRTEVAYYIGTPEHVRKRGRQKKIPVCHDVRLDAVKPVLMILTRSGSGRFLKGDAERSNYQ